MLCFLTRSRLVEVVFVLAVCLAIPACGKSKINKANLAKIQTGMTLKEVQGVLGEGEKQGGDGSGVAAQFGVAVEPAGSSSDSETYKWEDGKKTVTVYFEKGKVKKTDQTGL